MSEPKPDDAEPTAASRPWSAALPAALLVALLLAPTLLYPFARDQAVFTYVGKTIAEGGMPYRDAWDLKPPGIYLGYAALRHFSAGDAFRMMTVVRIADVLLACLTGLLLAHLGRRLGNGRLGITAAVWYAALYLQETYWGMAQAESWANPLLLSALILLPAADDRRPVRNVMLSGLLLGAVALLKPTALPPIVPFLFAVATPEGRREATRLGPSVALLVLWASIPIGFVFAWLKLGGAWDAYVDIQRGFVAPYARLHAPDLWTRVENVFGYTLGWSRDHWAPVALAVVGFLCARKSAETPFLRRTAAGIGLAWLGVCIQNKYFGYHWQPLLPFLALLAGAGTSAAMERLRPSLDRRWAVIAPLAWAIVAAGGDLVAAGRRSVGALSAAEWNARFGRPGRGDYSFEADRQVAAWLRTHSKPEERVLVWGFEPAIYLLAGRRCPTRFFFNIPVAVDFTPTAWREELLRTLRGTRPEWLIVARHDAVPWASGRTDDSTAQLERLADLKAWKERHYHLEAEIEDFRIYRLRPAGRAGPTAPTVQD
jgi:hypothetical protein